MQSIYSLISTAGNHYIVDVENKIIQFISSDISDLLKDKKVVDLYEEKKYRYWRKCNLFRQNNINYTLKKITPKDIEYNFMNTSQIVFEITDRCNLRCKYCGYGELYNNYDERKTTDFEIEQAKLFIDYYFSKCKSNNFQNDNLSFGFYGGEPLLNFDFVKELIYYIEKKYPRDNSYEYYMTTNGVLLDRYIDFIVEKNFNLLISLDGDKYASSYRVDFANNPVFEKVVHNVETLREKYPVYYHKKLNFNAVLHNRNTPEAIYDFFSSKYHKDPSIGLLNTTGINPDKKKKFSEMYNSDFIINNSSCLEKKTLRKNLIYKHGRFLHNNFYQYYGNYIDLLSERVNQLIIPTATCSPLQKKIFITVNGKILPCERIGQNIPLGKIQDNNLYIDFQEISDLYNQMYETMYKNECRTCYMINNCESCMFHVKLNKCLSKSNIHKFIDYIKEEIDFFESHRMFYSQISEVKFK